MALNRQKILNELGSVVNQLQSADCGCMEPLFQPPAQNTMGHHGHPLPTCGGCRRGCCQGHGNYYNPNASYGEPHPNNNQHYHCMGHCNPPKLYADTYNYLNTNLMQPVVKEVYDDLKSITPANTVSSNPLASQLGLTPGNPMAGDNIMPTNSGQAHTPNAVSNMQGMGPTIMNMIDGSGLKPSYGGQPSQLATTGMMDTNAQQNIQSRSGAVPNVMPYTNAGNAQTGNFGGQPQHVNQFAMQPNINMSNNAQNINPSSLPNANANSLESPMTAPSQIHGLHSQGVSKFKEMFPGVMQGDLGFDPMSIAIQMNPANQKQVAMDKMYDIMNNKPCVNRMFNNTPGLPEAVPSPSAPSATIPQTNLTNTLESNQIIQSGMNTPQTTSQIPNEVNNQSPEAQNQGNKPPVHLYESNQQAYPATTGNLEMNRQRILPPQYQQTGQVPNATADVTSPILPTIYEGTGKVPDNVHVSADINQSETIPQELIKEPIFPVNSLKFQDSTRLPHMKFVYNTLGQPIERLPTEMYHRPEPKLPQTLSPQPVSSGSKYNNVKATVSKTSLMGNKPVGKTPSRSQLQNIYNQYKGSQSSTQQNINATNGVTHSDGRLYVPKTNAPTANPLPIEKTGGDSAANNQMETNKFKGQVMGQIGDVPVENKQEKVAPQENRKYRNGLQDMVFTSYPTSAAWTFHGRDTYSAGYRYPNKVQF